MNISKNLTTTIISGIMLTALCTAAYSDSQVNTIKIYNECSKSHRFQLSRYVASIFPAYLYDTPEISHGKSHTHSSSKINLNKYNYLVGVGADPSSVYTIYTKGKSCKTATIYFDDLTDGKGKTSCAMSSAVNLSECS